MERGQVALFFIHSISILVQRVASVNALLTFGYHLKPIKMKQISAHAVKVFFAKLIASIVIIGTLMGSMAIVEFITGM
jgi:hypothetical protein